MRNIFLLALGLTVSAIVSAQTVTINFNGTNKNKGYELVLDGTSYYSTTNSSTQNSIVINTLQPGTHNLVVYRLNSGGTRRNNTAVYTKDFVLRSQYNMNINVNGNGQIAFAETRNRNRNNGNVYNNNSGSRTAISTYDYNQLVQNISNSYSQSNRYTTIYNAFNSSTGYNYTSAQVRQLLSMIDSESDRLYLAKLSYARLSDPNYFSVVYDLFPSVSARNELNSYVINNGGANSTVNSNVYVRTPMSDADFNQLLSNVQSSWFQSGKVNAVRSAFNNVSYIFSTSQIRQLLSIVNAESDRLALAKLAYARAANPNDFAALYDLLPSQASRNDLDYYIRSNGGNVVMSGSATANVSAVSDDAFSSFLFDLKLKLFRSAKVNAVKEYINTAGNYFTVAQVKELVDVGKDESDKIAIAKLAYAKTIDPANYTQIIDLIPSANGKAEVRAYIGVR